MPKPHIFGSGQIPSPTPTPTLKHVIFYFKSTHFETFLSSDENGKVFFVEKAGEHEKWIYDIKEGYLISFSFSRYLRGFSGDKGYLDTNLLNPDSSNKWDFYPSYTNFEL